MAWIKDFGGGSHTHNNKDQLDRLGINTNNNLTIDGVEKTGTGGSGYTLPTASTSVLGGVKVGSGLSINNGVLSAAGGTSSTGTTEHYKGLLSDFVAMDNNSYISTSLESGIYRVLEESKPPVMNPPLTEDFVLVHQRMFTTSNWSIQTAFPIANPSNIYVRKVLCGSPYTDGRQGSWKFIGEDVQTTLANTKKLLTMGDSITANWGGSVDSGTKQYPTDPNGYQPHIIKRLGINTYSCAYGGAKMARVLNHEPWDSRSFHSLATTLDFTLYDMITVAYGTNDAGWRLPLGGVNSTDPYTVQGSMNVGIQAIFTSNPKAQLFFITPILRADHTAPNTTDQQDYDLVKSYGDAIKEVCAKYDIPVFDGLKQSGINLRNYSTMLMNDKLHVKNPEGYELYGARIAQWLKSYI